MTTIFQQKAPSIVANLIRDFDLDAASAAAIVGNLGHESGGFKFLQEKKPLVPGSRGGYGWAQWTGPRRRAYEAWVAAKGLNPASDAANYGFLVHELQGSEKKAIPAVRAAAGLEAKVRAFEAAFERAGIKHYPSRYKYAEQALSAFTSGGASDPSAAGSVAATVTAAKTSGKWAESALPAYEVRAIQQRLLNLRYHVVGLVDGIWGERVGAAIKQLQQKAAKTDKSIVIDSHYGPQTKDLLDEKHGDKFAADVSKAREEITASDLAKKGTPGVVTGRRIQWASLLGALSALAGAAYTAWQAPADLPFGSSIALSFLPPWVAAMAPFLFTFLPLAYTALAGSGLVSTSVERVREGIDNSGSPPANPAPGGLFGSLFGGR